MSSATEALERLKAGNQRFVGDHREHRPFPDEAHRSELSRGQAPFAIVLGCADSRVPTEIVFDQGPGDLFVVRVAGNVVAPVVLESVEFAVEQFDTRLIVVLGHSRCGAVLAALDSIEAVAPSEPRRYGSIVDRVRRSVDPLVRAKHSSNPDDLVQRAVEANVLASVEQLRKESDSIGRRVHSDELLVQGAVYLLETGVVDFL